MCPSCRRFFCRECATEHEGRLLCSTCLRKLDRAAQAVVRRAWLRHAALGLGGFIFACLVFYAAGSALRSVTAATHEGGPWRGK